VQGWVGMEVKLNGDGWGWKRNIWGWVVICVTLVCNLDSPLLVKRSIMTEMTE